MSTVECTENGVPCIVAGPLAGHAVVYTTLSDIKCQTNNSIGSRIPGSVRFDIGNALDSVPEGDPEPSFYYATGSFEESPGEVKPVIAVIFVSFRCEVSAWTTSYSPEEELQVLREKMKALAPLGVPDTTLSVERDHLVRHGAGNSRG